MRPERFTIPAVSGLHEISIPTNTDLYAMDGMGLLGTVDAPRPVLHDERRFVVVKTGDPIPDGISEGPAQEKILHGVSDGWTVWEIDPPAYQGRLVIRYPKNETESA